MKGLNLIGEKFGKLEVKERLGNIGNNKRLVYWKCLCDCGNYIDVNTNNLRRGIVKSCGCYRNEFRKQKGIKVAANRLYKSYEKTAKRKDLQFDLDFWEFLKLVTDRCYYCGIEPQNIEKPVHFDNRDPERWLIYNGIDRVDSSRGYLKDNVVTCCTTCNYAKRRMSKEAFLNWVNRIYKHSVASISEKTPGMIIDELGTTLIKCFMAQEDILNPNKTIEQQKDAANRAQELNARRNKLIRALDSYFNLEDNSHTAKTYYSYFDPNNYERNENGEITKKDKDNG